jgi:hypothetical protein
MLWRLKKNLDVRPDSITSLGMEVRFPAVVISLTMFALGAESVFREGVGFDIVSGARRLDAELEVSFLELQRDGVARKLSSDEMRMEFFKWRERNAELFNKADELRKGSAAESVVPDPESPPTPAGLDPHDFLRSAQDYKKRLVGWLEKKPENRDNPDRLRLEIATAMNSPEVVTLDQAVCDIEKVIDSSRKVEEELPLTQEELAAMTEREQIEEEIHAVLQAAIHPPLAVGEELRDRIAPLEEWIGNKRKLFERESNLQDQAQAEERLRFLKSQSAGEVSAQ